MKDIIQAFQKLFPWVAELPLAPKLVISLIGVALAMRFLKLIWWESPQLLPWGAELELPLAYLLLSLLVVALVTLFLMLIWVTTERDS
jgi:hypothetical protein